MDRRPFNDQAHGARDGLAGARHSGSLQSEEFSLKYVCHLMGEVRSFIPRRSIEQGLLVSNWGTAISHTIAEHAILLALAALRCTL